MQIDHAYPFLVIDIIGKKLTEEDRSRLSHPAIAGVVLFARNDQSLEGLQRLCQSIKAINQEIIIMIDQEGGRVQRLTHDCDLLPSMLRLSEGYSNHPEKTKTLIQKVSKQCAAYLKSCGIDLNFSPVLDCHREHSTIIGSLERAFHKDPFIVAELAEVWIDAHHQEGILVCGKHFPGHGCAVGDTHIEGVEDAREYESIVSQDMVPYKQLKHKMDCVMTAHVVYPHCDPLPATLSPFWHDRLKQEVGYTGLVATDCLSMEGLSGSVIDNVKAALDVGCDFVLLCNCPNEVDSLLDESITIKQNASLSRINARVES